VTVAVLTAGQYLEEELPVVVEPLEVLLEMAEATMAVGLLVLAALVPLYLEVAQPLGEVVELQTTEETGVQWDAELTYSGTLGY